MRSSRLRVADGGPQTCDPRCPGCQIGAKKPRPSMWSRWRWVRQMWIGRGQALDKLEAEPAYSRARVEDDTGAVVEPRARRTTCCRRSGASPARRRKRAAAAPDPCSQGRSYWSSQKMPMIPLKAVVRPRSGNTVASIVRRSPVEAGDPQRAVCRPVLEERDAAGHLLPGERVAVHRLRARDDRPTR